MEPKLEYFQSTLNIRVLCGQNEGGDNIWRKKTFPNVKITAADADIYETGVSLSVVFGENADLLSVTRVGQFYNDGIPV